MKSISQHYITVRELLSLPDMKEVKVIAGSKGLDNIITSIDILEEPGFLPFINKNQLLLTTAYGFKEDVDLQLSLINQLKKKQASGLVIKLSKGYLSSAKHKIIASANNANFPLLEMPDHFSHTNIID